MLGGSPAAPPFASIKGCGPLILLLVRLLTTERAIEMTSSSDEGAECDGGRELELSTDQEGVSDSISACARVPISQLSCVSYAIRSTVRNDAPVCGALREARLHLVELVVGEALRVHWRE